ncbi:MAG TPA: hypothetical protein VNN21_06395 [Dehalococcoidia bacterium]|nr:hypothetical protein [Dehalococcoidia bacterium]
MAVLVALLAYGTPVAVGAGVVWLVQRVLRRSRKRPAGAADGEESAHEGVGAQLPTLTTEMTERVPRDPDFDLQAQQIRQRGMGW